MLDKNAVFDVMTAAVGAGADKAEIFVENCERNSVAMINGLIEKANWGVDYGCGIRVIKGFGAVYAYSNNTSTENLIKIAKDAAQAANDGSKGSRTGTDVFTEVMFDEINPVKILPANAKRADIVELLREASNASYTFNPLVTQTDGTYLAVTQNILVANSDGVWAEDRRVRTRVVVSAVASSESEKQTGYFAPGATCGFEFFERTDMKKMGRDAAEIAVTMLKADLCPSGRMPVLIENGFGGVIFHEACGHSLEATSVAKKASVFTDKIGQQIAAPIVSAIDDGLMPNVWGSINIDDEGALARRTVLIENGILKSYLIDCLNGKKMGMVSTGSGRRESYKYAPTSRMTNTYIAPGNETVAQIIADTPYGLYAKKMGGGSVEPATGEFNFAVLEGYMIRNGKIAEPVRGATLIGKGSEVLLNIDMISDNLSCAAGVCGSMSGGVPTNVGQPMIRVREMIVGGRDSD